MEYDINLTVGWKWVAMLTKSVSIVPRGKHTINQQNNANRTRHKINSQPNPRHIAVTRCLVGFTEFKFSSFGGVRRGTPGGGQSVHCYSVFSNHPGLRPPPPMDWNLVHKTGAVATITNHYPLTRTLLNLPLAFYQICYIIRIL